MRRLYKIYPIPLCLSTMDKGAMTYLRFYGEKISVGVYTWLIEGGEEPILVDAGCCAEEFRQYTLVSDEVKTITPVEEALSRRGISMSDIKTIILTHLDPDHFLNAKKFPNAKLIVHEEELRCARNPHPFLAKRYPKHLYQDEKLNFQTISGDTGIIPGVEIIPTPGHTPGSQSVAVDTEQGKVVIAGLCTTDENFSDEGDIIPGMHSDPCQAYDSMVKIRGIADIILPLHSRRLLNVTSVP